MAHGALPEGTRRRKGANAGKAMAAEVSVPGGGSNSSLHVKVATILVAAGAVAGCFWLYSVVGRPASELGANEIRSTSRSGNITEPAVYGYRIVKRYIHDELAFTQGLLWLNGSLYESTGLYGRSVVREVQLTQPGRVSTVGADAQESQSTASVGGMRVVREVPIGPNEFGEGLVHVGNGELLQLLWREGRGHRYSASVGEAGYLRRETEGFKTPLHDGWGLEFDGSSLLVTDSGSDVYFLDPKTFVLQRTMRVQDAGQPIEMVNELELVDGELWANIFGNECIARVAPDSGTVLGWVVLTGILNRKKARASAKRRGVDPPDVMNGIAFDAVSRRLFVTGKLWPRLYEIDLVPSNLTITEARRMCIPTHNIFRPR